MSLKSFYVLASALLPQRLIGAWAPCREEWKPAAAFRDEEIQMLSQSTISHDGSLPPGLNAPRLPSDGRLAFHLPSWPEPDGVKVEALLAAEGRLWISQRDGGVSAFDPATGSWTTFPRLRQVRTIRRSAANGHLLIYGYGGRGRALTWIDPKTAGQALVPGRWEEDPWGAVDDFHHDARGLWVPARPRPVPLDSGGGRARGSTCRPAPW
jgi:hypothetical protein